MEDFKLIEEVYRHPYLYDRSDPKHSNKEWVAQAWVEVAIECNTTVSKARRRWVNLRDYFRRQVRDEIRGTANSKRKKWLFFDKMSFLLPFVKRNDEDEMGNQKTEFEDYFDDYGEGESSQLPDADTDDRLSPEQAEETSSPKPMPRTADAVNVIDNPLTLSTITSKRDNAAAGSRPSLKRQAEDDVALELLKAIKKPETTDLDDDDHFFKSCIPMVKGLTHEQKLHFRINVQQLLLKYLEPSPTPGTIHKNGLASGPSSIDNDETLGEDKNHFLTK